MSRPSNRSLASLGAAVLLGAGVGAGSFALADQSASPTAAPAATTAASVTSLPTAARSAALTVNQIYTKADPGVVEITVTESGGSGGFGFGPGNGGGSATAQGSGFVYDTQGHVITNDHVVSGATSIKVALADGSTYTGTVVGTDPSTDLAVVKITAPASKLHPLALGDSSAVKVGDGVVAIGAPFGLENTVTAGIVSALHRQIQAPNNFTIQNAIQTDAAINHGNSGGPLLDLQGNVIGVTAQIDSESGGNDGVGFAIPSNTVKSIAQQLIASGSVQHAYLGVRIGDGNGGAKVSQVLAGTPAANAGLQAGDLVTAVDGKSISSAAELESAVDAKKPGDTITLTVQRNGTTKTLTVKLGTRPSS